MRQLGVKTDNISTTLLFPCLKIRQELIVQFSEFGFISTYLFWEHREYTFNVMYLVFQPAEFTLGFYEFVQAMEKDINFVETIDVPNKVIIVYKVPHRFNTDYIFFLNGAYSRTSPDFKSCFKLKNYKTDEQGQYLRNPSGSYQTEPTIYYHIFNKTDYLRDKWMERIGENVKLPKNMELYDKCDITKETLQL